jgi:excisionase family DNA binding protein
MESPQEGAPQRLLLRIPEVAETLGIGRTKIYELIATGELPTVRFGRKVVLAEKNVLSHIVLSVIHPFETHLLHKIPSSEGSKHKLAMLIIVQHVSTRKYTRPSATFHLT